MLKTLLFNRVRSDEGFVVKIRVYSGYVEYRKGDRVAVVPVEPVVGQPLVRVSYSTQFAWSAPHASDAMEERHRVDILNRIVEVLRFKNLRVEVVHS